MLSSSVSSSVCHAWQHGGLPGRLASVSIPHSCAVVPRVLYPRRLQAPRHTIKRNRRGQIFQAVEKQASPDLENFTYWLTENGVEGIHGPTQQAEFYYYGEDGRGLQTATVSRGSETSSMLCGQGVVNAVSPPAESGRGCHCLRHTSAKTLHAFPYTGRDLQDSS